MSTRRSAKAKALPAQFDCRTNSIIKVRLRMSRPNLFLLCCGRYHACQVQYAVDSLFVLWMHCGSVHRKRNFLRQLVGVLRMVVARKHELDGILPFVQQRQ